MYHEERVVSTGANDADLDAILRIPLREEKCEIRSK